MKLFKLTLLYACLYMTFYSLFMVSTKEVPVWLAFSPVVTGIAATSIMYSTTMKRQKKNHDDAYDSLVLDYRATLDMLGEANGRVQQFEMDAQGYQAQIQYLTKLADKRLIELGTVTDERDFYKSLLDKINSD